jgi:hypothetical protein
MKRFVQILFCFLLGILLFTSTKVTKAQNPVTGYITCSVAFQCATNPPNCQPGYRVPNECTADPNQCCTTLPYGHCELGGGCYCQTFIDCVPDTQPTPTSSVSMVGMFNNRQNSCVSFTMGHGHRQHCSGSKRKLLNH